MMPIILLGRLCLSMFVHFVHHVHFPDIGQFYHNPRRPRCFSIENPMKPTPTNDDHPRYFFDAGIRFECQRCGACCTGDPGVVRINNQEIQSVADFLEMLPSELIRLHLRPIDGGFSIVEEADGRCRFFDQGCLIYPVRPFQCRTFPFWFNLMRSSRQWQQVLKECPGIGFGELYTRERILDILSQYLDYLDCS